MSDVAHLMNTQLLRISSLWAGAGSRLRIMFLLLPYIAWILPIASGRTNTTVNLSTQARNPDFSSMPVTRPVSVGASLPSTCVVGQLFFNSSVTAGNNLYACTSTNTWNTLGSSLTLPLSVGNGGNGTSTPGLVAGSNVTITGSWPNQTINGTGSSVSVGASLPSTCTVGQLFFNSAAAAGSNLYGCTTANNWTVIGGATLTSPLPVANGGTGTATPSLVAGSNVAVTGSWPNQTIADTAISAGTSLPSTCTIGQLFFNKSAAAGSNLYGCTATNTFTVVGGATLTSPLPVANGGTGTATPALVAGTNVSVSGSWPNQTVNSANPVTVGSSTPAACTVGQLLYNTSAAAGSNFLGCTATNIWTSLGSATLTSPLPVANGGTGTATPSLVAGANVTITGTWPNQTISGVNIGASLPSSCTIGQLFFNSAASSGSNLYGCTASNAWTVLGGAILTSPLPVASGGNGTATPSLVAGSNVSITGTWPNQTISASSSGGTAGNATSIQGAGVSATAPVDSQTLVYSNTVSAYVPTSLYTLQNGMGTSTAGTSNLQVNISMGIRATTATSDTVLSTDCGGLVTYNNASTVAVALPQAGLAGNFVAGCPVTVRNYGAGALTITPSFSTIGGGTSQVVNQNKACLMVSDGTNWQLGSCN